MTLSSLRNSDFAHRKRIRVVPKRYNSPYKSLIQEFHKREIKEDDYFKARKILPLGMLNKISSYSEGFREEDLMGLIIDPQEHLNLGVVGASGMGKTRLIKNIIASYHKQGYKILIFSPKADEWSSARRKGNGTRLHPEMKNESLPVVTYSPSFVKHFLEENELERSTYKYYSHSIKNLKTREMWESLGFSPSVSNFCVSLVNQGCHKLKDMQKKIQFSTKVHPASKKSALEKIETMIGTKFANERLKELDLQSEWDTDNIIAINYFSYKSFMMSADVKIIVTKIREYCQKYVRKYGTTQPVLILFDDCNYYGESIPENKQSIQSIVDCQINYRSLGVNCIVGYQYPEVVDGDIVKGSSSRLVTYVESPSSLNGILPVEAIDVLRLGVDDGGLVVDKRNYNVEWIYRPEGREFWRFFPFDCTIGHD